MLLVLGLIFVQLWQRNFAAGRKFSPLLNLSFPSTWQNYLGQTLATYRERTKNTEIDTIEQQQIEKIKTEVRYDNRIWNIQVYTILSRVPFWGISFTQYHILFPTYRQTPLKKGNSQMDSPVQDNPEALPPCQYTLKAPLNSVLV